MLVSNGWEHISKQGNSLLRFLLVEAAQAAARIQPDWTSVHAAMRRHRTLPRWRWDAGWRFGCIGYGGMVAVFTILRLVRTGAAR